MATLHLSARELGELLERQTEGRVRLKGLARDTLDIAVKPARMLPAKSARVRLEGIAAGTLRLRLEPAFLAQLLEFAVEYPGVPR